MQARPVCTFKSVGNREAKLFVNTGCTHNRLSKAIFDHLLAPMGEKLLAGRNGIGGTDQELSFSMNFLISRISYDGILVMAFFTGRKCILC